ncbi:hypothetical protein [Dyadobacter sp. CY351]|uniref:hypothetical protein n=1 Tax=Dyadobacter sp. CY351 TaxID=2909337 RepID=UPI001F29139A|nr:hypothetical protein [Dyadobacter sp. CY351]MCF2518541.1 hypothetical protein [Dyadobacter sp. CY351]
MTQDDRIRFITDLPISDAAPYSEARITKSFNQKSLPVRSNEEQAFFSARSLVSFTSEVSAELRDDVLQSTLLAQLAANYQFPENSNIMKWFETFSEVLTKIGWLIEGSDYQIYRAKESSIEVDTVLLEILAAAFGSTYISILKKSLEAIKNMGTEDRKIKAFEKNVQSLSKSGFQIALATDVGGIVSLQIGAFVLNSAHQLSRVIFVKTEKDTTTLDYMSKKATLSPSAYSVVRSKVAEQLQDKLLLNIAEIKI